MSNQLHNQSTPIPEVEEYVKERLTQIHFISHKPFGFPYPLPQNIAKFICSDEVLLITGRSGTGKNFLLDNVIIPGLRKFRGIGDNVSNECTDAMEDFEFRQLTIFNRIDLLRESGQAQMIKGIKDNTRGDVRAGHCKYVFVSTASIKDLMDKSQSYGQDFNSFLTSGLKIKLPDIQTLFNQLPQLIESLVNQVQREQGFKPGSTFINLFEYIESVLWGISDNCHSLRKIISYSLEQVTPDGLLLDFRDDIKFRKDRIELWNDVFEPAKIVSLKQLKEFNKKHGSTHTWGDIASTKEEHYDPLFNEKIFVKRFKRYFTELVQHFDGNPLDKRIWEPFYECLSDQTSEDIQSGETISRKMCDISIEKKKELFDQFKKLGIITRSDLMLRALISTQAYAKSTENILITGDTGTGKQLVAEAIHQLSDRHDGPFRTQNCAGIPHSLLESELFGIEEKTASDVKKKIGIFEQADHGTLFLDEVGDMSPRMQAAVLNAIEKKVITWVGGTEEKKIDVRVITATNKDLKAEIEKKYFREDLYYRLGHHIELPALDERREDIPLLSQYFFDQLTKDVKIPFKVNESTFDSLRKKKWPGNVRELEFFISSVVVVAKNNLFHLSIALLKKIIQDPEAHLISEASMNYILRKTDDWKFLGTYIKNDFNAQGSEVELGSDREQITKRVHSSFLWLGDNYHFEIEKVSAHLLSEGYLEDKQVEKFAQILYDFYELIIKQYKKRSVKKPYYKEDVPKIEKLIHLGIN